MKTFRIPGHLLAAIVPGILFFFASPFAKGQDSLKGGLGKGIRFYAADSSLYTKFSFRFQSRYKASAPMKEDLAREEFGSHFFIRRSRLKFSGFAFHPDLRYKVELGLSNHDQDGINRHRSNAPNMILDAVLKWDIRENLSLWAGQTKLPGNRERVISSQELQFVDRSRVNANFNIDRDIGFQLHHQFHLGDVLIRDIVAFSQGEGRNIVTGAHGGYNYTGRVELLPFGAFTNGGDYFSSDLAREQDPKLALGFTMDHNRNAIREEGQTGEFLPYDRDLTHYHADLIFKYKGLSILSEYGRRDVRYPILYDQEGRPIGSFNAGDGWMVQGGYLFENGLELAARYTSINHESISIRPEVEEYTFGVSRYISGHDLKVQSDISYIENSFRPDPELRFRLQTELSF